MSLQEYHRDYLFQVKDNQPSETIRRCSKCDIVNEWRKCITRIQSITPGANTAGLPPQSVKRYILRQKIPHPDTPNAESVA